MIQDQCIFKASKFERKTCKHAQLFKESSIGEIFVINLEAVNNAQGPLLIEIDKLPGMKLGVHLTQTSHQGKPCLCIDHIDPMSIADRYVMDTETLLAFMTSKTAIDD